MSKAKYEIRMIIGQIVYLKTDVDKLKRMVTGVSIRENGVSYELTQGSQSSWHFEFEIDFERNKKVIGFTK